MHLKESYSGSQKVTNEAGVSRWCQCVLKGPSFHVRAWCRRRMRTRGQCISMRLVWFLQKGVGRHIGGDQHVQGRGLRRLASAEGDKSSLRKFVYEEAYAIGASCLRVCMRMN